MKILLTGANGYIGKRLLPLLVDEGHDVICAVRDPRRTELPAALRSKVTIAQADLLEPDSLQKLPHDIDAAYYLVHSMSNTGRFEQLEERAARNFTSYLDNTQAQQVIFLSGIANDEKLSAHLESRLNVENILMEGNVSATVLRAAIIIGSGSASFEMIRDLVEKLPVMITPKWVDRRCQPIAIRDVLQYLRGVLGKEAAYQQWFDIGGPDILTYKKMMLLYAKVRGLKRTIINVPVLTPRLSSYWLYFITSTSYSLAKNLVNSMKNEVIVEYKGIEDIIPIELIGYEEAVRLAFLRIEQNEVVSSWKDAAITGRIQQDYFNALEIPKHGCMVDQQSFSPADDDETVMERFWSIGGQNGWYYMNWAWRIRGLLDKLFGGVGLRRGRRSPTSLTEGDALDFWRVLVADRENMRLLLYAEMSLPGEAWLEFKIKDEGHDKRFIQTATFRPKGLWGRLYWYLLVPFHLFIFQGMATRIAGHKKSPQIEGQKTLMK